MGKATTESLVRSFSAAYSGQPKVLVLGSIPGVASLEAVQYYAHPRNSFWPIMADYFGFDAGLPYEQRLAVLNQHGVALWDVLQQCERQGSLDSAIRKHSIQVNPILEFARSLGSLQLIMLNGGKASSEFDKYFLEPLKAEGVRSISLPSTSPAFAAMPMLEKQRQWHDALDTVFKI
jgi:hypoxanthine-DNA glycosylase